MSCVMMNSTIIFAHLCCLTFLSFHFLICISASSDSRILCIPSERESLLKFKLNLTDPSNRLSSWNASNPNCCHWPGIVCSTVTSNVIELHLNISPPTYWYDYTSNNSPSYVFDGAAYEAFWRLKFGGELNPSLVDLKHLNYLDLSGNDFGHMPIPSFLGAMTSLTYLNLSSARFSGKIPHQIGNLSNLHYLDLEGNALEIPYQIGNLTNLLFLQMGGYELYYENLHWLSALSSLQYLYLSNANLFSSYDCLQTLQALPSLTNLHLPDCLLPLSNQPSQLNFSSLLTLDLFSIFNQFGTVYSAPKWIFGLTKLVSLKLSYNDFQGPIPDGIQNLTLLENLDLSKNSFSSSIPDWLYSLRHLKFLNLGYNNLHGTISGDLGNLTSLVTLDLSSNQLEGVILASLGNLCHLQEIDLSDVKLNQRVGDILEILAPCVSHGLKSLKIQSSQLSGNLTDHISVFQNIDELNLFDNSIHGELPRSFGKLSSLRSLVLSQNKFTGNPFEILRSLSKLSFLSIDDNIFQGVVKEDDLANLANLKLLYASGNNLTLEVPPEWIPNFQVFALDLSSWQLGSKFPTWIQSQKDLNYLYMSNTGISDSILNWFWEAFRHAYSVDLSHNHIHGELANTSINLISTYALDLSSNHLSGQLPQLSAELVVLDLSNNNFSGSMSELLCEKHDDLKKLEALHLASNNLSGEIPDCWLKWGDLTYVNLQGNHFVGKLPPSMGSLISLQALKIRSNLLSGKFPSILKNTNQLISVDLGENKFTGNFPAWVGEKLSNLKVLSLRSNKFSGDVPNQICAMTSLRVLDLAQNCFYGNIPNCLNYLDAMMLKDSTESTISVDLQSIGARYAKVSETLLLKGREDDYESILGLVTSIDFSGNKLSGDIPREITNLDGLHHLNLSHNQLTGHIPPSIGNMISLEAIDFSRNQLSGEIPPTISNLGFLSMMNLSYNHLVGKIPTGTQLQTFNASDFVGNNLCGPPLPINCTNDDHKGKKIDEHGVNWFFVSMAFGFVVGFWAVVAPLFIYRSWRHAYYRFLDQMWLKLQSFGKIFVRSDLCAKLEMDFCCSS